MSSFCWIETSLISDHTILLLPATSSILSALHLPERMKLDAFVNAYVLDVKKAGGTRDSSSSDDKSNTDRDNQTEQW